MKHIHPFDAFYHSETIRLLRESRKKGISRALGGLAQSEVGDEPVRETPTSAEPVIPAFRLTSLRGGDVGQQVDLEFLGSSPDLPPAA